MAPRETASSSRYLYERLTDKRFQELCGALLAHLFPNLTCYPVGQADGGRDAVHKNPTTGDAIYQVKWTSKPLRDPVAWLDSAINQEAENIKQLVKDGAAQYYLLTSIAGTSARNRGTMDKLDQRLAAHSKTFGVPMQCWWRADIDARVDSAPTSLKWTYQEMLAGVDAVRYVIEADDIEAKDQELRALLLKLLSTQWVDDAKVKFKQVELDSHFLADLFIDVEALRSGEARRTADLNPVSPPAEALGGAAAYLLAARRPLTLVRGEPGQGKSTLGQYLCQVHRAAFLPEGEYRPGPAPELTTASPRLPIRADLRDYSTWLSGRDPFSDGNKKGKAPRPGSIEQFLADLITTKSGGHKATQADVDDILHRFPTLVVLDGLDEVASPKTRDRVVAEIDRFASRLGNSVTPPQLVVTTRPNASGMAEPTQDMFETITLSRLSPKLRTAYLRRWADAQKIRGRDRHDLERNFRERSAEPHILQLADNPMQLSILLFLMHIRGSSVPVGRTNLYRSYMEKFLDREAAKTPAVEEFRDDLEEVTSFLGWRLQSQAEATKSNGQVATKDLKKAILDYLFGVEKDTSLVDALFTAVTDRVWALTSKVQGTFEFDVQPLREFFAARFLNEFAGAGLHGFDPSAVLRELVRRAYWLNTARFYAGFARPNELAGLVEGIAEELESQTTRPRQVRLATWTLLSDGVFSAKPRTQRQAVELLSDDLSIRLLTSIAKAPDRPALSAAWGGDAYASILKSQIENDPHSPIAGDRAALIGQLVPRRDFDDWWQPLLQAAATTEDQLAWLRIGRAADAPSRLHAQHIERLVLPDDHAVVTAAYAGVAPPDASDLGKRMTQVVLDGLALDYAIPTNTEAGDLLRAASPHSHLYRIREFNTDYGAGRALHQNHETDSQRQASFKRLRARDARFSKVQTARRFHKGQAGSVAPWGNTARALADIYGPCWLAAEIAVIGSGLPDMFTGAVDQTKGTDPLGTAADYGRLVWEVRRNRSNADWWKSLFESFDDDLSRATWALALVVAADQTVVQSSLALLHSVVTTLPDARLHALVSGSSRIGATGLLRRLSSELVEAGAALSPLVGLLLAQHSITFEQLDELPMFTNEELSDLARFGIGAWPALNASAARLRTNPSDELLDCLRRFGPSAPLLTMTLRRGDEEYARSILADSSHFPQSLVLAAEQLVTASLSDGPLADVAASKHWFEL